MIGLKLKKRNSRAFQSRGNVGRGGKKNVSVLKSILKDSAVDVQHVGSTSVPTIKAKPIIDVAVAAVSFEGVLKHVDELRAAGFYYRPSQPLPNQLLFAAGSRYDDTGDMQTHFIHVVLSNSTEWTDYINFRNYLCFHPDEASAYEALKLSLASAAPLDRGREMYLAGKRDFILNILAKARKALK